MLTLCAIGGLMGSFTGFIALSEWLPATADATTVGADALITALGTIFLALTLPSVVLSGFVACRGRNRLGGWLLLAHVMLVFLCSLGYWQAISRFIWLGLSPIFLAALLAAFGGPRPSRFLATVVAGCWVFLIGLGEGPGLIQSRFELAVSNSDVRTASRLLQWGADPQPGGNGLNPLLAAVEGNDINMVVLLMNQGASPLEADFVSNSAMTRSIELRHSDVTIAILEHLDMIPPGSKDNVGNEQ